MEILLFFRSSGTRVGPCVTWAGLASVRSRPDPAPAAASGSPESSSLGGEFPCTGGDWGLAVDVLCQNLTEARV